MNGLSIDAMEMKQVTETTKGRFQNVVYVGDKAPEYDKVALAQRHNDTYPLISHWIERNQDNNQTVMIWKCFLLRLLVAFFMGFEWEFSLAAKTYEERDMNRNWLVEKQEMQEMQPIIHA